MVKLTDYLEEFKSELESQLEEDTVRWGNTWLNRPVEGQYDRTQARLNDYYDQYKHGNQTYDVMKAIGNLYICWVRDNHPELFENDT